VQEAYNLEHGITPASIIKNIDEILSSVYERDYVTVSKAPDERDQFKTRGELEAFISTLEREMREAAANLEFERAGAIRDRLRRLRNPDLVTDQPSGPGVPGAATVPGSAGPAPGAARPTSKAARSRR
jgi:excinuclease ABC subunit B